MVYDFRCIEALLRLFRGNTGIFFRGGAGPRPPSYSPKTRRGGSRPTLVGAVADCAFAVYLSGNVVIEQILRYALVAIL
jgi:hypothetical protein